MDVEIQASIPKLQKHGKLHALRRISVLGRITYQILGFDGDSTVKKYVIDKYLSAEAEAQRSQTPSIAVTLENYKFKYAGRSELEGVHAFVFQVTPRKKRPGLYKGEIWIDAATFLRIQEVGDMVKSPSVVIKHVSFVRRYWIYNGISVPRQVQSVVDTRLVGKAELTIDYTNFSAPAAQPEALSEVTAQ